MCASKLSKLYYQGEQFAMEREWWCSRGEADGGK